MRDLAKRYWRIVRTSHYGADEYLHEDGSWSLNLPAARWFDSAVKAGRVADKYGDEPGIRIEAVQPA